MAFTTAEIGIELLMDVTNGLAEISDRMTAKAFGAVHNPEQGTTLSRGRRCGGCCRNCWLCWTARVRML